MHKAIVTALAAVALVVALAAPAFALRDPFDPAITPETETSTTDTTGTTTEADEPTVINNENPFSDGVPATGVDTSSWLVVSYVLVVVGGAAIVLGRTIRPIPPARRHDFRS